MNLQKYKLLETIVMKGSHAHRRLEHFGDTRYTYMWRCPFCINTVSTPQLSETNNVARTHLRSGCLASFIFRMTVEIYDPKEQ